MQRTKPIPLNQFTIKNTTFQITGTRVVNGRTLDTVKNITKSEPGPERFAEIERSRLLNLMKL